MNRPVPERPRRRHRKEIHEPGHAHELTFSCYQRRPFLLAERVRTWLAEAVAAAKRNHAFQLWAYVVMPEHVHLLVYPPTAGLPVRKILAGIKVSVARRAMHYLEDQKSPWLARLTRTRGGRTERLFWQSGGGYDRNITSGKTLLHVVDYLHLNPVRRGLVEQARDWQWSSAAWFEEGESPLPLDPIPGEWLQE